MNFGYRADVVVNNTVLLELKSVESLQQVHTAKIPIYLHLSDCAVGLLVNFNTVLLKDGLRRFSLRKSGASFTEH